MAVRLCGVNRRPPLPAVRAPLELGSQPTTNATLVSSGLHVRAGRPASVSLLAIAAFSAVAGDQTTLSLGRARHAIRVRVVSEPLRTLLLSGHASLADGPRRLCSLKSDLRLRYLLCVGRRDDEPARMSYAQRA